MHTILTISKDLEMVETWETLFKKKNCYVVNETTAYHALQTTRLLSPSLIIFNLELRKSEHVDLCRELRKMTVSPILLLSEKEANTFEYYQAGVNEHIIAPANPLFLLIRSMTWLIRQEDSPTRNRIAWAYA